MISDKDVATIARDHLINWESLRPYLGLSRPHEETIRQSHARNYGKQKQLCLDEWKEMKGNKATYGALITAAEYAGDQRLADAVRAMLPGTYMYIMYTHWEG